MEYKLITDIDFANNINERVFCIFLAKTADIVPQKNGKQFISVTMKCKSFELNAKLFDASPQDMEDLVAGKVYSAAVDIKPYAKSETGWGCVIYNYQEYTALTPAAFIEWAEGMEDANTTITNTLAVVCESEYKDIVYPILVEYWTKFCSWTAASGQHHNILGGLLVHTAEVLDQCNILADYWNKKYGASFINKPLLLSAAILHDICKVDELDVDTTTGATSYSTHSALSTHIMDILSRVDIQAYNVAFGRQYKENELSDNLELKTTEEIISEKESLDLLKHCLASHHGKLEWGSPITGHVPEANILNKADELSAEMFKYNKEFKVMECGTSSHSWASSGVVVTYKESSK